MTTLAVAYHRIADLEPDRAQIREGVIQGLAVDYWEGYETAIHDALHVIRQLAKDTRPPIDTTPPESPAAHLTTRNPADDPINPDDEYDVVACTLSYHHLTTNGATITCTCGHKPPANRTPSGQRLQDAITDHVDHATRHILQALAALYSRPSGDAHVDSDD
ncbi:MAG: hypothetical protein E7Z96_02595 [Actinomycetaceae bacterium]|nr:hypothetical protein [Actinomycetaceae bacterium]